ncbi:tetratricopeptide repeat protein [Terriglobus aquaticus]
MRTVESAPTPVSRQLSTAFVQTEQLRPMAQQLASTRSAAAYAGVQNYAAAHPGEGAAAAYLAIGHAYTLDRSYAAAGGAFRQAANAGTSLKDYADFLGAQASVQNHDATGAITLLTGFGTRYPDSIFAASAPVLLAQAYLLQNDGAAALRALATQMGQPASQKADYLLTEAKAHEQQGDNAAAASILRQIYVRLPFSPEAAQAKAELQKLNAGPSAGERKLHADALFNAHRYAEAGAEYHSIERDDASLGQADRDALEIYAAVCDLRQKHLSRRDAERLPQTSDDSAALRLYILAELARNDGDEAGNRSLLEQMEQRFPNSRWLEEGLYSSGNMYLIKRNSAQAIANYSELFRRFPNSTYAPSSHWRAAWLNYRSRNYAEAARLMEEQVAKYPTSTEAPSALYWRGRLFEDPEKNYAQAANFYNALNTSYQNYYYGVLARERLRAMGAQPTVAPAFPLSSVRTPPAPTLVQALPENDPHLIKARLLANAGLNDYIAPEIQASPGSGQWGALAQAEIYRSYGENVRSLQAIKRAGSSFFALPIREVPNEYWQLLFPRPYWSDLTTDAAAHGLDPYLVASLIRQESEFNPAAVSRANAYGLMQLLPSVGKAEAKKQGIGRFQTGMLLDPSTNLRLGTGNLKAVLDRFGGQAEYALAAYNAGDSPVRRWMAENNYKDIPEFVESIPYSETRDYVQSILRNREMYRQLYAGQ